MCLSFHLNHMHMLLELFQLGTYLILCASDLTIFVCTVRFSYSTKLLANIDFAT